MKRAGLTLGCIGALALGSDYIWTGNHTSGLWAQELNWLKDCPPPFCTPQVGGYPDDATDNARITWGEEELIIELSTETIDQLLVTVDEDEDHLALHFISDTAGGDTLSCDNIALQARYGDLELTVKDRAELKTVD